MNISRRSSGNKQPPNQLAGRRIALHLSKEDRLHRAALSRVLLSSTTKSRPPEASPAVCFPFLFCLASLAFVFLSLAACSRPTDERPVVRIAAAADLKFALDTFLRELADEMRGLQVAVTYGSSGNLRTQIEQDAPFDLFLSADYRFPEQLISAGRAEPGSLFAYAVGRLVIWVPTNSPLDVETLQERTLLAPGVRKLAIANPDHAPYGQAAVAALKNYGIFEQVAPRFVFGENIAQTAQFVDSGAADIGIIALSLAVSPTMMERGRFWELPLEKFPRLLQGGVILKASRHQSEAEKIATLLQSEKGRAILQRYGFLLPESGVPPS